MPQEPKRKHSKMRKRVRRAAIKLKAFGLNKCPNCGQPVIAHEVCKNCSFYKGCEIKIKSRVRITKA